MLEYYEVFSLFVFTIAFVAAVVRRGTGANLWEA